MIAQPPIPLPDLWTLGDLERMRLILGGGSVIDWRRLHFQTKEEVDHYLRLCLFEPNDPFDRARLQRILDEAVGYLRTTFRYAVAEEVAQPAQVEDLFLLASGIGDPKLRKIACLVLKVMHVVHHVEARGLLYRARVSEDEVCQLVTQRVDHCIAQLRREGFPVVAAAGSVKTRHSLITKLLAKKETLAAQIYDKVRYRVDAGDGRIAFCMVELQLVDRETALANERGENAHLRYKRRQLRRVLRRLSRGLVVPRRPKPVKAP